MWYDLTSYMEADSQFVNFVTIPRDEDNTYKDYLADYWEDLMLADPHCPDTITSILQIMPTQNLDPYLPGFLPLQLGDQLTTFEEYRGFYCRGIHTRTSPWQRDFFIYSDLDSSALNTGIGYADLIGPGLGHWIDSTEMRNYFEPDTGAYPGVDQRSINWLNERIDSSVTCPCAILLQDLECDTSSPQIDVLGQTWFYGDSLHFYHVPQNTKFANVYTRRIRYWTPWSSNPDSVEAAVDSAWQNWVAGHEIGHMVDMRDNDTSYTSVMGNRVDSLNWHRPHDRYLQEDLDYFLVKPP